MYNYSTTLIPFTVTSNGTEFSGTVPYDLLWLIKDGFQPTAGTGAVLTYTIDMETYTVDYSAINKASVDSAIISAVTGNEFASNDPSHPANIAYYSIKETRDFFNASQDGIAALHAMAQQLEIDLQIQAQGALIDNVHTVQLYEEAMSQFAQEQQQHIQTLLAEEQRLDELRALTVRQVAVDPMQYAVPALMGEVGTTGDVRRQIAAAILRNHEVGKVVVASTSSLWNASYEITDALSRSATAHPDLASVLCDALPDDSSLKQILKTLNLTQE